MTKFQDIKGYEGKYVINTQGQVVSFYWPKHKMLKHSYLSRGYATVALTKNKKVKQHRIHRLLAEQFIPNPNNKPHINHIDGDKTNNRIENLEWCTQEENNQHGRLAKLSSIQVGVIRTSGLPRKVLAKHYNVTTATINDVVNRKTWKNINQ